MSLRFADRTCIVTGGARNIGYATVNAFLEEGARVAIVDRDEAAVLKAATSLTAEDPSRADRLLAVPCDITKEEAVAGAMADIEARFGSIDVLVNNAGVCTLSPALELTVEAWDLVLGVNLKGMWLCVKHAAPRMRQDGAVVNVASQAAQRAQKFTAHYSASKMGVIGLTRALAVELGPNIRVNAISPGTIETDMIQQEVDWRIARKVDHDAAAVMTGWLDRIPLGRFQQPEHIASGILFLASREASEITGETLNVSGGAVMV